MAASKAALLQVFLSIPPLCLIRKTNNDNGSPFHAQSNILRLKQNHNLGHKFFT